MEDVVNRLARELSDAIAAAVADDKRVQAVREKARSAGFEMQVTLEAVIGFMSRNGEGKPKPAAAAQAHAQKVVKQVERKNFEISANDRRFLRSLRIAADETQEKQVE